MKVEEIIEQLKTLGNESTRSVLLKHGAVEPIFGVKVEDLKKIQRKIKTDHQLSLDLYKTNISDAMYLAGLISDGSKMNRQQLQLWVEAAPWQMISEYTVPWVASEFAEGWELALEWIDSTKESIAASGWCTLAAIVSMKADDQLDLVKVRSLMKRIEDTIHSEKNRVKYTMNGFLLAVGIYVKPLSEEAIAMAERIGKVKVNMGDTACKVPFAPDYIRKAIDKGYLGKKRKTVRC